MCEATVYEIKLNLSSYIYLLKLVRYGR